MARVHHLALPRSLGEYPCIEVRVWGELAFSMEGIQPSPFLQTHRESYSYWTGVPLHRHTTLCHTHDTNAYVGKHKDTRTHTNGLPHACTYSDQHNSTYTKLFEHFLITFSTVRSDFLLHIIFIHLWLAVRFYQDYKKEKLRTPG